MLYSMLLTSILILIMIILLINIVMSRPVEKDFYDKYYDKEEERPYVVKLNRPNYHNNASFPIKSQYVELPLDDPKLYNRSFTTFNDADSKEVDVRGVIKRYYNTAFKSETDGYH